MGVRNRMTREERIAHAKKHAIKNPEKRHWCKACQRYVRPSAFLCGHSNKVTKYGKTLVEA